LQKLDHWLSVTHMAAKVRCAFAACLSVRGGLSSGQTDSPWLTALLGTRLRVLDSNHRMAQRGRMSRHHPSARTSGAPHDFGRCRAPDGSPCEHRQTIPRRYIQKLRFLQSCRRCTRRCSNYHSATRRFPRVLIYCPCTPLDTCTANSPLRGHQA
jgi:hypothetical protein